MNYQFKYAKSSQQRKSHLGRPIDPDDWCTGPDPIRHDKYYAWLKHKAQANFRGEEHNITWEEWESIWTDELWAKRGRLATDLCLGRLDHLGEWSIHNVHVVPRSEHLKRQKEFLRAK